MAQTGYTPIQLYYSTTASAIPTAGNLASGELAINITDGKLYFKNNSGTVTLLAGSGGAITPITNNGVVYVNSSGQATSGSALTFDGSSLVGTGKFQAQVARIKDASYSELYFSTADTGGNGVIGYAQGTNQMYFYANGSEAMRLTSTGLGIGTSSPSGLLTLNKSSGAYSLNLDGGGYGTLAKFGVVNVGTDNSSYIGTISNNNFLIKTYNSTVATFDTSGNLGLGVTPSAWNSAYKAFEMGSGSVVYPATSSNLQIVQNAYNNSSGSWLYKTTGYSSLLSVSDGGFKVFTGGTGTAGNAITFTQAMTLSASAVLNIDSGTGGGRLTFSPGSTANQILSTTTGYAAYNILKHQASSYQWLNASGSQAMTLSSSGYLGLNNTSPGAWLDVDGGYNAAARFRNVYTFSNQNYAVAIAGDGSTTGYISQNPAAGGIVIADGMTYYGGGPWRPDGTSASSIQQLGGNIIFTANTGLTGGVNFTPTEIGRFVAAGNFGLGVTPSAWSSAFKAIQVGTTASISTYNSQNTNIGYNWYYSATTADTRLTTGYASLYQQDTGNHRWWIAGTGSAGSAISFTQAMTLTSANDLLLGTTTNTGATAGQNFVMGSTAANKIAFQISGAESSFVYNNSGELSLGYPSGGVLNFQRVGTGTVASIDNNGNLLVGTTGLDGRFRVEVGAANWARVTNHTNGGTQYFDSFRYNGTQIGYISGNNTATAYNTSSDYRLKNTIAPMTGALAKVALLKPCTYKWNADGSDGEGFIAHELAEVVPQCVTGEKDAVDEEGNPKYQGIDTSFLVATLTAAIQEQQAIIDSLKARLDAANL